MTLLAGVGSSLPLHVLRKRGSEVSHNPTSSIHAMENSMQLALTPHRHFDAGSNDSGGGSNDIKSRPTAPRLPVIPPEWRAAVDVIATQLRAELPRDAENFRSFFAAVNGALDYIHQPLIAALSEYLAILEGFSFGSLEENQVFTRALRETLNRLQLRIRCPQAYCGQPGTLQCISPKGDFRIAHQGENNTRHLGRMVLPPLELVPPAADRRVGPK